MYLCLYPPLNLNCKLREGRAHFQLSFYFQNILVSIHPVGFLKEFVGLFQIESIGNISNIFLVIKNNEYALLVICFYNTAMCIYCESISLFTAPPMLPALEIR